MQRDAGRHGSSMRGGRGAATQASGRGRGQVEAVMAWAHHHQWWDAGPPQGFIIFIFLILSSPVMKPVVMGPITTASFCSSDLTIT